VLIRLPRRARARRVQFVSVYKDRKVALPQAVFQKLSTGFFASAGQIMWNRFTGPGKIALQSMYYHMDGGE
jgi:hypothetical protein